MDLDVYQVLMSRRSVRRFQQKSVSFYLLRRCVYAARLAPSAANLQPLEFIVVTDKKLCEGVFAALHWAAYIKPAWKPRVDERPVAYIVILVRDKASPWYLRDVSFAAGNIVHVAEAAGLGSCILCKIEKEQIDALKIIGGVAIGLLALGAFAKWLSKK